METLELTITENVLVDYGAIADDATKETANDRTRECNDNQKEDISYYSLVKNNYEFRLFILSFVITNLGEWLTYIASIDFIDTQLAKTGSVPRTAISILILVRLLPNIFLATCGGTLADAHDRRNVMVILNLGGAACAVLFVLAYQVESVLLMYVVTFVQQCLDGLYQPSSNSIIPMLVHGDDELKKATTLEGLGWSAMTAFGAAASGIVVDAFGCRTCFLLDGLTFLISASLLWRLPGNYNVSDSDKLDSYESPWQQFQAMSRDGFAYLSSSYFGALVLLKFTSALTSGPTDILNVAIAESSGGGDSNMRLGVLFGVLGIGCLLGPLVTEPLVDVERPTTVQLSCVVGFALKSFGYAGWSLPGIPFWCIGVFGLVRAAGTATIWINSTLLLQKFCAKEVLGRVLAIDFMLALVGEAPTAYLCGIVMDQFHLQTDQVSLVLSIVSLIFALLWAWYHFSGRGAGKYVPGSSPSSSWQGQRGSTLEAVDLLP